MAEPTDGAERGRQPLLMVLEAYFPSTGGAERQLEVVAGALMDRGHDVVVVVPRFERRSPAGADRHGRLRLWRIGFPAVPLLGGLVLQARLAWLLWRWRHRYAAIHVHVAHHMGAVCAAMGRLLGKPVVVKFSGWWEAEKGCLRRDAAPMAVLCRLLLRRASAFQAISSRIAADLAAAGFPASRIHCIPNAVDTSRFDALPRPRPGANPPRMVFVGRLVPEKCLDLLLEAWRLAGLGALGWRLRIVGVGPMEGELRALAARLGIDSFVEWAGESSQVEEHLAAADVGVLVSRAEGLSNTLLEYFAAGIPVVATQVSGSEDFVVHGSNGWLSPPGDAAALAANLSACAALDAEPRTRMGLQARADVARRAAVPAVVARLEALYRGSRPEGG